MRTLLAATALILTLSGGAWANDSRTPNTADKAAEAALAFFSAPALSPSASVTLPDTFWDVTEPASAVRRQYRLGLDSLQAGEAAPYLALLAPNYTQPGADRAETAQRLTEMLARNRCDSAEFSITEARMKSATQIDVRIWQKLVFTSKNTPPTYMTTAPGKTSIINQTGRLTVTQIVREEWVQSGTAWRLHRAETVAQKAAIVL